MLQLHWSLHLLFLTYLRFLCKWKSLSWWQKKGAPFQSNRQSPFSSANKTQTKQSFTLAEERQQNQGASFFSLTCFRSVAEQLVAGRWGGWQVHLWLSWHLMSRNSNSKPTSNVILQTALLQAFFFTHLWNILGSPSLQTTLKDGDVNYPFTCSSSPKRDVFILYLWLWFPTVHTLLSTSLGDPSPSRTQRPDPPLIPHPAAQSYSHPHALAMAECRRPCPTPPSAGHIVTAHTNITRGLPSHGMWGPSKVLFPGLCTSLVSPVAKEAPAISHPPRV